MHPYLKVLATLGWAFVPGLLFFALLVLPELRWQHRHLDGRTRPQLWFWVTLLALLCFGLIPYVLLHVVGVR